VYLSPYGGLPLPHSQPFMKSLRASRRDADGARYYILVLVPGADLFFALDARGQREGLQHFVDGEPASPQPSLCTRRRQPVTWSMSALM